MGAIRGVGEFYHLPTGCGLHLISFSVSTSSILVVVMWQSCETDSSSPYIVEVKNEFFFEQRHHDVLINVM